MRTVTKSIDLISKKTNYLHVQHTLMYISLPLFFTHTMPFCTTKTSNFLITHYFLWRNCRMCSSKFWCLVSCSLLFFSLPLIFTLLAASISHLSHRRYEIFTFFSFVFNYSLWLLLCYPRECRYKK